MKNLKTNLGSFATAKLQAKMRSILAIIALVAVIGFSMVSCGGGGGGDDDDDDKDGGGVVWTAVTDTTFGTDDNINGIAWGGTAGSEKFVAVGSGGKAAYSADGVTWTAVDDTTFGTAAINGIAWGGTAGNEKFVAVGGNKAAYSADGVTWTAVSDTTFGTAAIRSIAWGGTTGNEKFVAVGGNKAAYSADGVTWTAANFGISSPSIAWGGTTGNEKFVVVGISNTIPDNTGIAGYSADGVTWTAVTDTTFGTTAISGIAWGGTAGNEKFVAVGIGYKKAAYSADGVTWTAVTDTKFIFEKGIDDSINGITWGGTAGNEKFVAVGISNDYNYGGRSSIGKASYSADGVTWTAVSDTKFDTKGTGESISGIAWGGTTGKEKFVAVGINGKAAYWDGK